MTVPQPTAPPAKYTVSGDRRMEMGVWWIAVVSPLLLWCCEGSSAHQLSVDPPQDLQIVDPGLLGHLYMQWKPPLSLEASHQCPVTYKLKYRNAGDTDWKVIFTKKLKYGDNFDLNRPVEAKVQTLLEGPCANGSEVQSEWTHASFQLPLQGALESRIQDFRCVYYNWEHLRCTWQPGRQAPPGARYELYYWYAGLGDLAQCADYIWTRGKTTGCQLLNLRQAEYLDINICVNGSAEPAQLQPSYFILQIKNLVKPPPPERLALSMSASKEIHVQWSSPEGGTPAECLEYEVQLQGSDGHADAAWSSASTQLETAFVFSQANGTRLSCVRVRGRTNIFCADQGFWSDWTQECFYVPREDGKQLFILVAVVLSFFSVILVIVFAVHRKKRALAAKKLQPPTGC
ncbi:interleukin-13 receptor subunit alpha-2 isoform X2 [Alligator mississippiensis]|uniref:interleukin-13 receptor subunit alpha-2 isoform X2 n=1 Tax=Alligator mississippiensis TaxID=8496 RepID=UPI00287766D1|nr:interleukin-13 receptor subunit alpha-2 isoform X2 [Alligator mississippiensis]